MDKDYQELKKWLEETKDQPLETMAGFFDARINLYEEHMARWKAHYQWMAELLPASIESLLDIGCGTGLELDYIFARFPDLQTVGVDISEEMLRKLHSKHRDKNLTLVCQDYFTYDMGKEQYDAVVSFETLHHYTAEKKKVLFKKIFDCLKPGGVYLECDYIATSQAIEDLVFSEFRRRRLRDGIKDDVFVHFDTPLTLEHELNAIKEAGFKAVELVGFLPGDNHTAMIKAVK
ncbi:MAG: class I SAM-dependent methyltransferase [Clostridiales bacterium]|jgi:tRNA (cmo5U34)-methyltransferase|nr:class I SAM-dependent methyltransferase [Clostridiales bacterium]